ncbi:hypothetical protein GW17_00059640 [Ensete ventricosum]|uniref:Uncharacterized protein n=1 Tax=Ensete ventricosum TaxID=4639 RepID=A0A444C038_ENSVE|nr:hypothetical protein GW17_00059640 [Ensete ventricosum]RZR70596.1 hypothetical protein BHM03_00000688 [Ensete ventricosum]
MVVGVKRRGSQLGSKGDRTVRSDNNCVAGRMVGEQQNADGGKGIVVVMVGVTVGNRTTGEGIAEGVTAIACGEVATTKG